MAAVPPEGEETSEPLKCKTWVLKVSIHCEGCKRKVKRILHTVDGVYTIDVDAKQHKVTVTGNVDSNSLLTKLEKSGKHAELWPNSLKYTTNLKKNKDSSSQNSQGQPQIRINPTVEGEKVAVDSDELPRSNLELRNSNSGIENNISSTQEEGNIPVTGDEKKSPENNPSAGINGGGSGGKKKKKKGHKCNNTTTDNTNNKGDSTAQPNGGPQSTESFSPPPHPSQAPDPNPKPCTVRMSPPRQHGNNRHSGHAPDPNPNPSPVSVSPPHHQGSNWVYEYPSAYYAPPSPPPPAVYGVSYNMAYPTSNYTTSYYSAPQPYSYAYVHSGHVEPPALSDWYPASSQPADSLELFSDENPNACSIM